MTARSGLALWFGVFGPPLAWAGNLVVGYYFEEIACSDGSRTWWSGEHWWQVGTTIVALAIALVGAAAAFATLRVTRRGEVADPRGRVLFLAGLAAVSSVYFLALIALTGAYVIILDPCTAG